MISRNKPQRGRMGTAYHIEKSHKQIEVNCKHYDIDDGSCYARSIILWQVGYDICKNCRSKLPIYDEKEKTKKKKTTKKTSKKRNTKK